MKPVRTPATAADRAALLVAQLRVGGMARLVCGQVAVCVALLALSIEPTVWHLFGVGVATIVLDLVRLSVWWARHGGGRR